MRLGRDDVLALASVRGLSVYAHSLTRVDEAEVGLAQCEGREELVILAAPDSRLFKEFDGRVSSVDGRTLLTGPTDDRNVRALRKRVSWTAPRTQGLRTSAGTGDRLGLATPGHVRAMADAGGVIAPFYAQQSIREMQRTKRSPGQVLDDATWGVFAEGWRAGFGADADHLKSTADIDACMEAGYTFFTLDPGDRVDDRAEDVDVSGLRSLVAALPWEQLEDSERDLRKRYLGGPWRFEAHEIAFDEASLYRAAAKYGGAVAQATAMYRHLEQAANRPVEVEVSVDETSLPTSHAEHVYLVTEMARLGMTWVSLAPRYVGTFEKGVEYIGDVATLERDVAVHAAIARTLGPYKLGLHSGSDKFSVFGLFARQTHGLMHLKTSGTSYLEALKLVADVDVSLFRDIYTFCRERYQKDRASYHVSARPENAPEAAEVTDADLPALLYQPDAREILHVTFGSVLNDDPDRCRRLIGLLRTNRELYADRLKAHFSRHLIPLVKEYPHA